MLLSVIKAELKFEWDWMNLIEGSGADAGVLGERKKFLHFIYEKHYLILLQYTGWIKLGGQKKNHLFRNYVYIQLQGGQKFW